MKIILKVARDIELRTSHLISSETAQQNHRLLSSLRPNHGLDATTFMGDCWHGNCTVISQSSKFSLYFVFDDLNKFLSYHCRVYRYPCSDTNQNM